MEQHDLTPNKPFGSCTSSCTSSCTLDMGPCNLPAHSGIQARFFAGEAWLDSEASVSSGS